jgi:hypothetical protein
LDRFMSSYLIFVTIYGCGGREPRGLPRVVNSPTQIIALSLMQHECKRVRCRAPELAPG